MNFIYDYFFQTEFMNAWDYKRNPAFVGNTTLDYKIFESCNPEKSKVGVWPVNNNRLFDTEKATHSRVFHTIDKNGKTIDNKEYIYRIDMYGGIGNAFPILEENETFEQRKHNVLELIPQKTLDAIIKNKNIHIMLNYFQEGIIEYFHLKDIHNTLHRLKIPTNQCILSFGGHNIDNWYAEFCRNYSITQKIKVVYHSWVWQTKSLEFNHYKKEGMTSHISSDYKTKIKKYDFNCLNRRLRTHRLYTLAVLEKYGLLDNNIVTYDFTIPENIPHIVEITDYDISQNHVYNFKFLKKHLFNLYENKPKKTYDFDDLQNLYGINHEKASVYEDSMFSLVTETTVLPEEYYISEKVVKPIGHNHPFIVFGSIGTLEHLKKMGFKTFEPHIDESYDKEQRPETRFNLILNQVRLLCEKSDEEKIQWMERVKPIIEHNRKHLDTFIDMKSYYQDYHNKIDILIKKKE